MRHYYVYILASERRRLYVGVTSGLMQRLWQHRQAVGTSFTARDRIVKLVHFEQFGDVRAAIAREKAIKSWRRERKERLVATPNAGWLDLSAPWFDHDPAATSVDPGCSSLRQAGS